MNKSSLHRVIALLTTCMFMMLAGCASLDSMVKGAPEENNVTVRSLSPEQPAVLAFGERLQVKVAYERLTTNDTVIIVRPYYEGRAATESKAHPAASCAGVRGVITGWITFESAASIDEIHVTMLDQVDRVVLGTERYPVDMRWSE